MEFLHLKENDIIEGPFWPEPVKVIRVDHLGENIGIKVVGIYSQKFFDQILLKMIFKR